MLLIQTCIHLNITSKKKIVSLPHIFNTEILKIGHSLQFNWSQFRHFFSIILPLCWVVTCKWPLASDISDRGTIEAEDRKQTKDLAFFWFWSNVYCAKQAKRHTLKHGNSLFLRLWAKVAMRYFPRYKIIALLTPIALSGQKPKLLLNQAD